MTLEPSRIPQSVTIQLTPEAGKLLVERASQSGQDPEGYAAALLEHELKRASLEELMAPFRTAVEESRETDEELDAFFEGIRDEVWRDRQSRGRIAS